MRRAKKAIIIKQYASYSQFVKRDVNRENLLFSLKINENLPLSFLTFSESRRIKGAMNVLDVVIVGIMGMSLLYSVWRGFVRDVFSLVGIVGGFLVAARFHPQAAEWVKPWVSSPWLASAVGFAVLFLTVFLFVLVLGRLVWKAVRVLHLGWADRLAGLGFGFLKGILVCAGIVVVLEFFPWARAPLLEGSRLAPHVKEVAWELGRQVPGQLGERFRKGQTPWKEERERTEERERSEGARP